MSAKIKYCQLYDTLSDPNEETKKVFSYLCNSYFFLKEGSFLGQAGHIMAQLTNKENQNLEVILSKTKETLMPFIPFDLTNFENVDWKFIAIKFLYQELFNEE